MDLKLKKPDMLAEAQKYGSKALWVECLQFLGIFLLIQLAVSLVMIPIAAAFFFVLGIAQGSSQLQNIQKLIPDLSNILSLLLQAISILLTVVLARGIQKRKIWTLGFKKKNWLKEYGIGMLVGLGMMSFLVFVAWLSGSMAVVFNPKVLSFRGITFLILYFVGFLIQGMSEEVLCRGYFLISLGRRKGNLWMAIFVSSLLFAAAHLLNPGITFLAFCNLTLFGVFAGVYFLKRGNIWGIGAMHSLWNFAQGNIWGVCVSGAITGPSLFVSSPNAMASFLNGGRFGLEGGILTTIVLVCGIVLLLMLKQKDVAEEA